MNLPQVKNILFLWLLIFLFPGIARCETLKGAIGKFYCNNQQLFSSYTDVQGAKFGAVGGFMSLLPDIRLQNSSNSTDSYLTEQEIFAGTSKNESSTLLFSQEFSLNNILVAPTMGLSNLALQKKIFRVGEQRLLLAAVNLYLNVIRDQEILKASEDNVSVLTKYSELNAKRFKLGEITLTDSAQSMSRLESAKATRLESKGRLTSTIASFERVFGTKPDNLEPPEFEKLPSIPQSFEEFLVCSLAKNATLAASKIEKRMALQDIGRTASNLLPSLEVSYSQTKFPDGFMPESILKSRNSTTVSLKFPILPRGGAEAASLIGKKLRYNKSIYDFNDHMLGLKEEATTDWENLITTEGALQATKAALEAASLALASMRKEAEFGSRTTLDVLTLELDYFNTKVSLIKAKHNRIMAKFKIFALLDLLDRGFFENFVC